MKLRTLPALFLSAAALGVTVLVTGCSDYKVDVESDTTWSGVFAGKSVDGAGNSTIDVPDDGELCIVIQKNTRGGFVQVSVRDTGGSSYQTDWERTEGAYGTIEFCVNPP